MTATWNSYAGGMDESNFLQVLLNCLKFGSVTDASTQSATISFGNLSVVFEGDIVLDGGNPDTGTIDTIRVYDGDALIAEATGYQLDVDAIGATANAIQSGGSLNDLFALLTMQPLIFNGSEEADLFVGGDFDDRFAGNGGDDLFYGAGGMDRLFGGDGLDVLEGGEGADTLSGGIGDDELAGGEGDDTVKGGAGDDLIYGNAGEDMLRGGGGGDTFQFSHDHVLGEVDTIAKFGSTDRIALDHTVFAGIGGGGALAAGKFHVGSNAHDANDRIIYKATTGALYYDADGDGAGAKVKFAILENAPDLSASDFMVI